MANPKGADAMDWPGMLAGASIATAVQLIPKVINYWREAGVSDATIAQRVATLREDWLTFKADFREDWKTFRTTMGDANDEFTDKLEANVSEMQALVLMVTKAQATQDSVNVVTAKTLDALARKSEAQDKALVELQTTASFIRQLLEREEERKK